MLSTHLKPNMALNMALNYTTIQTSLTLLILITVLGFIVIHLLLFIRSAKSKNTAKTFIKKLTRFGIYLIWLIGVSVALMVFGFIADCYTFEYFLWVPFEMVVLTSLVGLFVISMNIAYFGKECGIHFHYYLRLLAKHLINQMKLILAVTFILVVKLSF